MSEQTFGLMVIMACIVFSQVINVDWYVLNLYSEL